MPSLSRVRTRNKVIRVRGAKVLAEFCQDIPTKCCAVSVPPNASGYGPLSGSSTGGNTGPPSSWGQPWLCNNVLIPGTLTLTIAGPRGPCRSGYTKATSPDPAISVNGFGVYPDASCPSPVPGANLLNAAYTADYWPNGSVTFTHVGGGVYVAAGASDVPTGTYHSIGNYYATPADDFDVTVPACPVIYPFQFNPSPFYHLRASNTYCFGSYGGGGSTTFWGQPCVAGPYNPGGLWDDRGNYTVLLQRAGGTFMPPNDVDTIEDAGLQECQEPPAGTDHKALALCRTIVDQSISCTNASFNTVPPGGGIRILAYGARFESYRMAYLLPADNCQFIFAPYSCVARFESIDSESFNNDLSSTPVSYGRQTNINVPYIFQVGDCIDTLGVPSPLTLGATVLGTYGTMFTLS